MMSTLRWRLLVAPLVVLVSAVMLELVLVLRTVHGTAENLSSQTATVFVHRSSRLLELALKAHDTLPERRRFERGLTYLARESGGAIVFLPTVPAAERPVHRLAFGPEADRRSLRGISPAAWYAVLEGQTWRWTEDQGRIAVLAAPAIWGGRVQGAVVFSGPSRSRHLAGVLIATMVEAGLAAMVLGVVLWWLESRRIARPLGELIAMARRLESGDFAVRGRIAYPREYAELSRALSSMAQNLERTEIARREFLATVAHELKTPLTALTGYMEALGDGTVPEERATIYREKCLDEVARLSRQLDDFLDMAKAEAGRLELAVRRISLRETVSRAVLLWEHAIRQKHLGMEVDFPDDPVEIEADPDRVQQIVSNLLSNAVNYTPRGGRVRVRVWLETEPGDLVAAGKGGEAYPVDGSRQAAVVEVADTGPAIPEEVLPHLWDRYVRWLPSGRARGTGLGLAIVRTLVRAHGGTVQARSEDGWTRFLVRLPRHFEWTEETAPAVPFRPSAPGSFELGGGRAPKEPHRAGPGDRDGARA